MTLTTYFALLVVGSATIFALRKTKLSIPTQPQQTWKPLTIGWCAGITILYVWELLSTMIN